MVIGAFSRIINLTESNSSIIVESNNPIQPSTHKNSNPYSIVCYGSGKAFETNGDKNEDWVQIKVKKFQISVNSYRIKTFYYSSNYSHLKKWELRASNDNRTWETIGSEDTDALNKNDVEETFHTTSKKRFSIFRIVIFESWYKDLPKRLSLSEFDVNGEIYPYKKCSQINRNRFINSLFAFIFIALS